MSQFFMEEETGVANLDAKEGKIGRKREYMTNSQQEWIAPIGPPGMGTFLVSQGMKSDSEFRSVSVSFMTKFHEYRGFRQTPGSEKYPVPTRDSKISKVSVSSMTNDYVSS
jgi:hypothetical protein